MDVSKVSFSFSASLGGSLAASIIAAVVMEAFLFLPPPLDLLLCPLVPCPAREEVREDGGEEESEAVVAASEVPMVSRLTSSPS